MQRGWQRLRLRSYQHDVDDNIREMHTGVIVKDVCPLVAEYHVHQTILNIQYLLELHRSEANWPPGESNGNSHQYRSSSSICSSLWVFFSQKVTNPMESGVEILNSTLGEETSSVTYRTDVATLRANGAWNVLEADTRRTDWLARTAGPNLIFANMSGYF